MESVATITLVLIIGIIFGSGAAFILTSLQEGEPRAAWRGIWLTLTAVVLLAGSLTLSSRGKSIVLGLLLGLGLILIILYILPVGRISPETKEPESRFDEREVIFARARLIPGTEQYQEYYQHHPDHKEPDDHARNKPGLLSPEASLTDPLQSAAAEASFFLTEALREAVDGPVAEERIAGSPEDFTRTVKYLALHYGALDVGITSLKSGHIYSHIGRGTGVYGTEVDLPHQYGIAFTGEMDFDLTNSAPYPPITMESGRQYAEAARVAIQLAAFIRMLGYSARAHIDGNYRVIAPLVARDAGLGEIGRMGLLMTPKSGPRVRIGVVTTDLPLIPDLYIPDQSTLDFCQICKKCAHNCPSQSISHEDRKVDNGVLRWRINPESCYHYWTVVGTDCGKCMAVCPYSHPDNWIHNLVRQGIKRSGIFRRAALVMDDFFYGKKPPSRGKWVLPKL
jgi:ferredoxin